ncbi:MAG TPA: 50S ribosomal protein L29 [Candidatus Goldiibacteriota bacterium]|nr:50S ribosomal protein L29 [Candidatus Goldiibacteriota bacterium]HPN65532.1 50S ribosomal protein L29 [Candidatus Goldiibacteriota bacterium]HRQ42967.1 50S ribosomal protein L29 [Candidatus Goldiibacteriota bacterium]
MKAQEFRDMTSDEIERKMTELKEQLFKLKLKLSTKQIEKTSQIKTIKQDIARALTVLKQKKNGKEAVNVGKK